MFIDFLAKTYDYNDRYINLPLGGEGGMHSMTDEVGVITNLTPHQSLSVTASPRRRSLL